MVHFWCIDTPSTVSSGCRAEGQYLIRGSFLGGDDGTRTHDPLLANKPTQDTCERLRTLAA
jgi:hypothetical protein